MRRHADPRRICGWRSTACRATRARRCSTASTIEPDHRRRLHRRRRRHLPDARRAPHGGRTSFASFARAWDRYTEAPAARAAPPSASCARSARCSRPASYEDDAARPRARPPPSSARARRPRARPAGRDRRARPHRASSASRHGWAWLRVFRRLDEYEARARRRGAQADAAKPRARATASASSSS